MRPGFGTSAAMSVAVGYPRLRYPPHFVHPLTAERHAELDLRRVEVAEMKVPQVLVYVPSGVAQSLDTDFSERAIRCLLHRREACDGVHLAGAVNDHCRRRDVFNAGNNDREERKHQ